MIAAIKDDALQSKRDANAQRTRDFATFYGIRKQHLATSLGFELRSP